MLNPWILLGVAILWALSAFGIGKWQYRVGEEHERVTWQAREVAQVNAANAAIKRLNDEARSLEAQHAADMNVIAANYAKGYEDAEARRRRDVAAARDGALVLRIPASACAGAGGGSPATAGPPAAGRDDSQGVQLPRAVTADLLALANDADAVADQLRACQQIALTDRKGQP